MRQVRIFWPRSLICLILISFLHLPRSINGGKDKDKCGVQVVAIEQIKYKPIPVEVMEKSAMKYEQPSAPAPPPASYSQPTTAAPTYATTTGAPMPKPTTTTSKKMDITELIKEMYGPPPQKAVPPTPPPPPQVYIMPAPAPPPPQRPQMVYMVTNPAPAPPTRPPMSTYSQMRPPQTSYQHMMPPMMSMMIPEAPYMQTPLPQPPVPMQPYGHQQPMMMNQNYGQMMGVVVENQPPTNAQVNNYGNSVTPNNYAPAPGTTTPAMPTAYGQGVATTAPPSQTKLHASSSEDDYGNSQHLVSFPEMSNDERDYYGSSLNGPIRGMNINNQMRPYEEMSSQVRKKYPSPESDYNGSDEDDDEEGEEQVVENPARRQRQRPVDVVLGYRVRPQSSSQPQLSNFSPPDPTFRDILMTKLKSNSFGRRSSSSKMSRSLSKGEMKKIEAEDNQKVLSELRLRSQIEQTLDRILFNTHL